MSAIPIVLVSGFLGAGKTTLTRRLIASAHEHKKRVCVIVNEFGASDVDGSILKQADAEMLASVAGGCACCSGQDDFLWTLLDVAERDGANRPDVILVECSGLADPLLMLDSITVARLLPLVRLGALIAVADAASFEQMRHEAGALLGRQLQLADIVVLNKIDIAGDQPQVLAARLQEAAPFAQIVPATECDIDFGPLWTQVEHGNAPQNKPRQSDSQSHSDSAHTRTQTVVCPLPHPVDGAWLRESLASLGAEVWRAKGFVRLRGEAQVQLVQVTNGSAGPRVEIKPFAFFETGASEIPTELVFIGPALDREALRAKFGSMATLPMI